MKAMHVLVVSLALFVIISAGLVLSTETAYACAGYCCPYDSHNCWTRCTCGDPESPNWYCNAGGVNKRCFGDASCYAFCVQ